MMKIHKILSLLLILLFSASLVSCFREDEEVKRYARQVEEDYRGSVSVTSAEFDLSAEGEGSAVITFKNEGNAHITFFEDRPFELYVMIYGVWSNTLLERSTCEGYGEGYNESMRRAIAPGEELTVTKDLGKHHLKRDGLYKMVLPMDCTLYFDVYSEGERDFRFKSRPTYLGLADDLNANGDRRVTASNDFSSLVSYDLTPGEEEIVIDLKNMIHNNVISVYASDAELYRLDKGKWKNVTKDRAENESEPTKISLGISKTLRIPLSDFDISKNAVYELILRVEAEGADEMYLRILFDFYSIEDRI